MTNPTQNPTNRAARAGLVATAIALASVVLWSALTAWMTGLTNPYELGDPGDVVRWGQPILRSVTNLAMAVAIGGAIFAVLSLSDGAKNLVRTLNLVAMAGAAWVLFGSASYLFTYLSITGLPVSFDGAFTDGLVLFATEVALGQSLAINLALGLLTATLAVMVRSLKGTVAVAVSAVAALVPLAVSGHASGTAGHAMAVNSIGLHLLAVVVWVGGLVALPFATSGETSERASVLVKRYSALALAAFAVTAISGSANALVRLQLDQLFTTTYGLLVVGKIVTLAVLGVFGAYYRLRVIGQLESQKTRTWFGRLALAELVVMGVAMGLAATLSRTGAPDNTNYNQDPTPAEILTGEPLPSELLATSWFTEFKFDLLWSIICVGLAALYIWGVLRLRKRGDKWPIARTASWMLGLALLFYITNGAINVYGEYLFSVHMIGHMMLSMGVPVFLVPGAPITLLMRAVNKRTDGSMSIRDWVLWAVHTPWAKLVSHPIFAAVNFAGSLVLFYFTPLFEWSVRDHLGHQWMTVHFLITGYLFVQALVGVDPGPNRLQYPVRLMLLIGTLAFHAFFGLALMDGSALLVADWFGAMGRTWGAPPLQDQHDGGAIAWGIGELPTAVLTIIVSVQWARSDARESKRLDRASDRSGNQDIEDYNAMLARLAKRDEQ